MEKHDAVNCLILLHFCLKLLIMPLWGYPPPTSLYHAPHSWPMLNLQNDLWKIWPQLPDIFLHRQSNPTKVRHCCLYSHVYVCTHLQLLFEGGTLSSAHRFSKCLLPVSVESATQVPRSVSYISDIDLTAIFRPFNHVLRHVSTLPYSAVLQTEGSVTVHCNGSGCTFALMHTDTSTHLQ